MLEIKRELSLAESQPKYIYNIINDIIPKVLVDIIFDYIDSHFEELKYVKSMGELEKCNIKICKELSEKRFCSKIYENKDKLYIWQSKYYKEQVRISYDILVFDRQTYEVKNYIGDTYQLFIGNIGLRFSQFDNLLIDFYEPLFNHDMPPHVSIYENEKLMHRWNLDSRNIKDCCTSKDCVYVAYDNYVQVYSHIGVLLYEWPTDIKITSIAIKGNDIFIISGVLKPILYIFNKLGVLLKQYCLDFQVSMFLKIVILNNNLFVISDNMILVYDIIYFKYRKN